MIVEKAFEKSYAQFQGDLAQKDAQMVDLSTKVHALTQKLEILL